MLTDVCKGQVDEVRQELSPGDEEPICAHKGSPNLSGRGFGDVERGGHRSHSDSKPDEDPANDQKGRVRRCSHDHCPDEEEEIGHKDCAPPPELIVRPPTYSSSNDCSSNCHAHYGLLHSRGPSLNTHASGEKGGKKKRSTEK